MLSLIEMGARVYSPELGRFLQVDPIDGGSENDYDYVGGDPVNGFDLKGESFFGAVARVASSAVNAANAIVRGATSIAQAKARARGIELMRRNNNFVVRKGMPGVHWPDAKGVPHQNRLEWDPKNKWHFNDATKKGSHRHPIVGVAKATAHGLSNIGKMSMKVFDGLPTPVMITDELLCIHGGCEAGAIL